MKLRVLGALCASLLMLTAGDCSDKGGAKDSAYRQMSAAKKSKLDALPKNTKLSDLSPTEKKELEGIFAEIYTESMDLGAVVKTSCAIGSFGRETCESDFKECLAEGQKHEEELKNQIPVISKKMLDTGMKHGLQTNEIPSFWKFFGDILVTIPRGLKCGATEDDLKKFEEENDARFQKEYPDVYEKMKKTFKEMQEN